MPDTTLPVTFVPAHGNNFLIGRQGRAVDAIVCHWIVGHQAAADATFRDPNRRASATYSVEGDSIHLHVREKDTAFANGNWDWNLRAISIEHAGGPNLPITEATYRTSAALIADICARHGIPIDRDHIKKHNEVSDVATACPGDLDVDRLVGMAREIQGVGDNEDDMTLEDVIRNAYKTFQPRNAPSDEVIRAHADYIRSGYPLASWLEGFARDGGWKSNIEYEMDALRAYDQARGGADPEKFAWDRYAGGSRFRDVIGGDMPAYLRTIDEQRQQLTAKDEEIQNLHIALEKTEAPAPTPQTETPKEAEKAPTKEDTQEVSTPTAQGTSGDLSADEVGFIKSLYLFLSNLFLGR